MPKRDAEAFLAIGRLGAPRGLRGDLKVQSYSGETEHFFKLKAAVLRSAPEAASASPKLLELAVLRVESLGSGLSMAFAGYDSPEKARALTGMEILAPRSSCAPLKENEWYIADLVGLHLVAEGRVVATVRSVLEGGPEPWLEAVRPDEGVSLVPFRKEFVGSIDLEAGTIELLAPYLLEE
jgi:16S rRNA processing protein RimM